MIEIKNVSVSFIKDKQEFKAVDDVSLHIKQGEFFGIVGSSGAGKSTLVRTVNLLQRPTAGQIFVDKQEITSLQDQQLNQLRLKIGMIFQHFNLIKNASVFDNIAFALQASRTDKEKIASRVTQLLEIVGLEDKVHTYPNSLSGGQKQRVAIARALANRPQILLCDEATSALDPDNTKEVIATLKNIKQNYPLTVLFITHQMEVAKSLFDTVAVMANGRIEELGSAYDIFAHPHTKATQNLLHKSLDGVIPAEVLAHEQNLYLVTFKEKNAYDPLIAEVSRNFPQIDLSIIAGDIEYIQQKPLGRLLISLRGDNAQQRDQALAYLKTKAYVHSFDKEL